MIDVRVKDALDHIAQLIKSYKIERKVYARVGKNDEANLFANMIKQLEKIQDKLIGQ